jgi:carboxylesterase type B
MVCITLITGDTLSYFNIPYAASPVGPLRFKEAMPPLNESNKGVQDATKPGPSCMLLPSASFLNHGATPSEDCLRLNVFMPKSATPSSNLPVFVHVYGGGFTDGYSTFPYGQGARNIISQGNDVIIVEMNYRLGAFGFLPSPELLAEGNLNLGIKDVAASFRWVRKYIKEFGGNPRKVTAFGFSAGAITLSTLLMAKDGTLDLFDKAFLMSGGPLPRIETIPQVRYISDHLVDLLNCTEVPQLDCLRKVSADALLKASIEINSAVDNVLGTVYGPFIDGDFIARAHTESLKKGLFRKVPLMINTNLDEAM